MRRVYAMLERAAISDATVLLRGETGTGKEAAARALHDASDRANAGFVAIDCGAIAENLIESELFGHTRGAFSGAVQDRAGLFEQAEGGTLFLDEVGELPLALQPKLLRALETCEVRRVGGNTSKRVDVRIVAATNRDLARNVDGGTFREDLYYRLAVIEVELPPLRVRREDIPLLAQHFYWVFSGKNEPLPPELMRPLMGRAWPGNVPRAQKLRGAQCGARLGRRKGRGGHHWCAIRSHPVSKRSRPPSCRSERPARSGPDSSTRSTLAPSWHAPEET